MTMDDDGEDDPDLMERVARAYCIHLFDNTYPLVKLGRFEGVRAIGSGSFGIVFIVRDPELKRQVALKLCKFPDAKARARLIKEAQILAKLSHRNILTVHEVGEYEGGDEHEGSSFIVMELIEGGTGRRLIAKRPRWEDCVDVYRCAGRGLIAAHSERIVHGDFKPSNIMLGEGRVCVGDFGLAHTVGSADEYIGGTPRYMAPEILDGGVSTPLADQWSFCVSLWETIEGLRPFDEASPMSLLSNIETEEPNVCASDSMPPRLRQALSRGLALDPSERWPDMEALVDELDEIRAQPIELPPGGRPRLRGGIVVTAFLGGMLAMFLLSLLIPWEATSIEVSSTQQGESNEDVRSEGIAEALRGYSAARIALDSGDIFACYEEWIRAHFKLQTYNPGKAGELSLALAGSMATIDAGDIRAARVSIAAAKSFEVLAQERGRMAATPRRVAEALSWTRVVEVLDASVASTWERASQARTRAAEVYRAAEQPKAADEQSTCAEHNALGQRCPGGATSDALAD